MDASTRSSKSNAFFTGFGSNHRLVLEDTLLDRHTEPELLAIVAHEVGHYKKRHIPVRTTIEVLHLGVFFLLMSLFVGAKALFQAFYVDRPSVYLGIVFFLLLYSPLAFLWSILLNWLARKQEYAADLFAAVTTGQPAALAEALRKLTVDNLSQVTPHPVDVFLNYSHPPPHDRIRALTALAARNVLRGTP
jgi:STE24 endopeptidase